MVEIMRERVAEWAEKFINWEIVGLAFLLPLFFLPITVEFYEFNKLILLAVIVTLGALAWALKAVLTGKLGIRRSPFDLPVLVFWLVTLVSTIFSATVGALLFLPQYFGANLFGQDWSNRVTFTPLGSPAVLALFIGAVAGVVLKKLLDAQNRWLKIALTADLFVFTAVLTLLGSAVGGLALVAAVLTTVLTSSLATLTKSRFHILGALAAGLVFALIVFGPPLFGKSTFLNRSFPQEVTLDLRNSWSVSATSFRQKPFWGSGPSTFLSDFTRYKPLRFNQSQLWTIRFDKPLNEYLLTFAEEGLIGILAWLILIVVVIREAIRRKGWEALPLAGAVLAGFIL